MAGVGTTTRRSRFSVRTGKSFGRVEHGLHRRQRLMQVAAKYGNAAHYAPHFSGTDPLRPRYSDFMELGREPVPASRPAGAGPARSAVPLSDPTTRAPGTSGRIFSSRIASTDFSKISSP